MPPKRQDLSGRKFGFLTVIEYAGKYFNSPLWRCKCECGREYIGRAQRLTSGRIDNCGCQSHLKNTTHGKSNSKEYKSWLKIRGRCLNPNDDAYDEYGGRGITICPRWMGENGSINFLKDMGPAPSPKHSVDRRDVNGNYEPTNCRWATEKEQASNKRNNVYLKYGADNLTTAEWARRLGIDPSFIRKRWAKGQTIAQIINEKQISYLYKEPETPKISFSFGFIK